MSAITIRMRQRIAQIRRELDLLERDIEMQEGVLKLKPPKKAKRKAKRKAAKKTPGRAPAKKAARKSKKPAATKTRRAPRQMDLELDFLNKPPRGASTTRRGRGGR